MTLVVPNVKGEILLLQYIVGMVNADNPVLHLYTNNVTPSESTVIGDLVEMGTGVGYVPITLLSNHWTTTQVGGVTTAVYSEQTFSFTTNVSSYGYYITDGANSLLWLEMFPAPPFNIPPDGGNISVTAELVLS